MTTKYQQYLQRKKKIMQTFAIGTKVKFNEENLSVERLMTNQTGIEYTVEKKPFIDALKNEVYCLPYENENGETFHVYVNAHRLTPVVPVVDVVESIRELLPDNESKSVMRDNYKLVQTPQVFEASTLLRAYEQRYTSSFTDDASVVETMGTDIHLVQGNRENIKITTPFDLKIADSLLK